MFILSLTLLTIECLIYLFLSGMVIEHFINRYRKRKRYEYVQWLEWLWKLGLEDTASIALRNAPKDDSEFFDNLLDRVFGRWI